MKTINSCTSPSSTNATRSGYTKRPRRTSPTISSRGGPSSSVGSGGTYGKSVMMACQSKRQDERQDEDGQSSLFWSFLDRLSCAPTQVVGEPEEIIYEALRNKKKAQQSMMQSSPILYVHRYQTKTDTESRDPAPLPTIKSCDTDTTANNSDDDSSFIVLEDEAGLNYFNRIAGRATPTISNTSSMYSNSPHPMGLRKCHCFDEEDAKEAPHAQAIVIDNRDLLDNEQLRE